MPIGPDPISSIQGGVVGIGPVTSALGKIPGVGPSIKGLFSSGKDFNDAPYGQTVGSEGGNPLQAGSIDAASTDITGGAAGGLGDLAAVAAF